MILRFLLACVLLVAFTGLAAALVLSPTPTRTTAILGTAAGEDAATLALAPITLGNPTVAAALNIVPPATPSSDLLAPRPYRQTLRARSGDTLASLLDLAGITPAESHAAIRALSKHMDPRRIRAGQEITVLLGPTTADRQGDAFLGLEMNLEFPDRVDVARTEDGGFVASREARAVTKTPTRRAASISTSLFVDGVKASVPTAILSEMIRAYSWDVDFQRDIHPDDSFEVLYDAYVDAGGSTVHAGDLVYASLTLADKPITIYRYTSAKGDTDFYNAKGESVRKALLRTPVDGARLSSGYGMRKHPILGYSKMHRGVDFAAPRGTPIYAAGSGKVAFVGRRGGYGKYIRITHNKTYATAYAHLHRYAKGIRAGKRVRQGQVIGYVGSTGRSTGPHLHYEVLKNGRQVSPMKVKFRAGRKLAGAEKKRFLALVADIDRRVLALARQSEGTALADAGD